MNNTTFLIESLKRTLSDLSRTTLSVEEQSQLSEITTTIDFIRLFNIPEEQTKQLTERELSSMTEYCWNTVYAGLQLCGNENLFMDKNGAVMIRINNGSHHLTYSSHLVFRLLEVGDELTPYETHDAIFRVVDKVTREISTVHFEVTHKQTAESLFRMIKDYLPERYAVTVKKL